MLKYSSPSNLINLINKPSQDPAGVIISLSFKAKCCSFIPFFLGWRPFINESLKTRGGNGKGKVVLKLGARIRILNWGLLKTIFQGGATSFEPTTFAPSQLCKLMMLLNLKKSVQQLRISLLVTLEDLLAVRKFRVHFISNFLGTLLNIICVGPFWIHPRHSAKQVRRSDHECS